MLGLAGVVIGALVEMEKAVGAERVWTSGGKNGRLGRRIVRVERQGAVRTRAVFLHFGNECGDKQEGASVLLLLARTYLLY